MSEKILTFLDVIGVKHGPCFSLFLCDDCFEMKLLRNKLPTLNRCREECKNNIDLQLKDDGFSQKCEFIKQTIRKLNILPFNLIALLMKYAIKLS